MKLYKATITPISNFATALKGDTIFGQMCWAIRYKYGNDRLEEFLSNYDKEPFLVVSDGFVAGYLPKPTMPSFLLNENSEEKKENRKKVWLTLEELENSNFTNARTDKEVENISKNITTIRNSINYKTFTTDGDNFSPYGETEQILSKKDIYFLISDKFTLNELKESFELMSDIGYGKDSTIGKGRFEYSDFEEITLNNSSSTFMTISPTSLKNIKCKKVFYNPITKFGKHSGEISKNPFKKPIILADSGAVMIFNEKIEKSYIGNSITGISIDIKTVHQGYSIVIPIKEIER